MSIIYILPLNERAGGDGGIHRLLHAGRALPAAPQHEC